MFRRKRRGSRFDEVARRAFEKRQRPGFMLWPVGLFLPLVVYVLHVMEQQGAAFVVWLAVLAVLYACVTYFTHEFLKARTDMEGKARSCTALLVALPVSGLLCYLEATSMAPAVLLLVSLPLLVYWQYRRGRTWSRVAV